MARAWVALRSAAVALSVAAAASGSGNWYDGLEGVKVLHPGNPHNQQVVRDIFATQRTGQFNSKRFAIILLAGDHTWLDVPVGYYTGVYGAAEDPGQVRVRNVQSFNGPVGGATQNFWRSVEGVTVLADNTWAVSQGAPVRRSTFQGNLYLSDNWGWSSGGFMADTRVRGLVDTGSQQQWFYRNVDVNAMSCPAGWNFVIMGQRGLNWGQVGACQGTTVGKVTNIGHTKRIAEKPYLVLGDDRKTWKINVPRHKTFSQGATDEYHYDASKRLDLETEVFVAKPGHTAIDINKGIAGKKGLLLTPGVYHLSSPIVIKEEGFVVLGIGFPTLTATAGLSAIRVADGLPDVRIAGLLLEGGTVQESRFRRVKFGACRDLGHTPINDLHMCTAAAKDLGIEGLKLHGTQEMSRPEGCYVRNVKGKKTLWMGSNPANKGKGAETSQRNMQILRHPICMRQVGGATHPLLVWGTGASSGEHNQRATYAGVLSDVFARVGSFRYQGCHYTRADTMLEINSDDVILDNTWLWHADHDDCAQKSDSCYSAHGLVVNGNRVTSYGMAAEHSVDGNIVQWNGEHGETYFFQCELPYNTPGFGTAQYVGYSVAPHVKEHTAIGLGVYIVGPLWVKSAYVLPPKAVTHNLITIVIGKNPKQFLNTACVRGGTGHGWNCHSPQHCDWMRCVLPTLPNSPPAMQFLK